MFGLNNSLQYISFPWASPAGMSQQDMLPMQAVEKVTVYLTAKPLRNASPWWKEPIQFMMPG